jgi:hypothetical protein
VTRSATNDRGGHKGERHGGSAEFGAGGFYVLTFGYRLIASDG